MRAIDDQTTVRRATQTARRPHWEERRHNIGTRRLGRLFDTPLNDPSQCRRETAALASPPLAERPPGKARGAIDKH